MAFLKTDFGEKYLSDYYNGLIPQGQGIGIKNVDNHLSFKKGQFNLGIGIDNVGKTDFYLWYFLVLALKYNYKIDIWSGENKPEQQKRKLIQMYYGSKLTELTYTQVQKGKLIIENYFNWIDRGELYNHKQLLDLYSDTQSDICFVDPLNGLEHKEQFGTTKSTYRISNDIRQFCNHTNKSVYVSAHTVTEASRRQYPKDHELSGYVMPPIKSHIEGGQQWASRADDFHVWHRLTNHEHLKWFTQLEVVKVKDTETGGGQTMKDSPLCFEFNKGLGYKYVDIDILNPSTSFNDNKQDALEDLRPSRIIKQEVKQIIKPNINFDDMLVDVDNGIDPF